jgi:hypothetical protein
VYSGLFLIDLGLVACINLFGALAFEVQKTCIHKSPATDIQPLILLIILQPPTNIDIGPGAESGSA